MNMSEHNESGVKIAVIKADASGSVIRDTQSALDLMLTVQYELGTNRLALYKEAVVNDFFILSNGIAGEILQKYINYGVKLAIIGDYSGYTSKPLRDFIYESNNGTHFFFVDSELEAFKKLSAP